MFILLMHFVLISDEACTSNDLDGGPDHVDNCTPSKSPTKFDCGNRLPCIVGGKLD